LGGGWGRGQAEDSVSEAIRGAFACLRIVATTCGVGIYIMTTHSKGAVTMLQRIAGSPTPLRVRVLGGSIGTILLGVLLFTPIPHQLVPHSIVEFSFFFGGSLIVLLAIATLTILLQRSPLHFHQGLLVLTLGLLVLYGAFILWPAYHSGLAWFTGNPKGAEEFESYHVWYRRQGQIDPALFDLILFLVVLGTKLASQYVLIPLSIALALSLCWWWPEIDEETRWSTVAVILITIAVPLMTRTAANQFMIWLID
jgi:hypothetical protein